MLTHLATSHVLLNILLHSCPKYQPHNVLVCSKITRMDPFSRVMKFRKQQRDLSISVLPHLLSHIKQMPQPSIHYLDWASRFISSSSIIPCNCTSEFIYSHHLSTSAKLVVYKAAKFILQRHTISRPLICIEFQNCTPI